MTTPGSLALVIIVFAVVVSNAVTTVLTFVPLGLFVAALVYLVKHV